MSTAEVIDFPISEVKRVADLDNGYTRIANELLEAIALFPFTSRQYKILISVVLKTYRFHKKTDWIANSQFEKLSGLPATKCSTVKNELLGMNVLVSNGRECGINKNMNEWKSKFDQNGKTFTKTVKKSFTKTVNNPLPKRSNTKETITKDNKDNTPISPKGENSSAEIIEIDNKANELLEYYNTSRNAHCSSTKPFLKALNTKKSKGECYSVDDIKLVIDWFAIKVSPDAKPENICRMKRFDGYLSDAIAMKANQVDYSKVQELFNDICGDKLGHIDSLTPKRIKKIDILMNELAKKNNATLEALESYLTILMDISTEKDICDPSRNWALTFDYVMTLDCLTKTREKYNRINRGDV